MPSRDVKVDVVPVVMLFPCKSLAEAIEAEDMIETKDIGAIDRTAVAIAVYFLAHDIVGDHGAAVSHASLLSFSSSWLPPAMVLNYETFNARFESVVMREE